MIRYTILWTNFVPSTMLRLSWIHRAQTASSHAPDGATCTLLYRPAVAPRTAPCPQSAHHAGVTGEPLLAVPEVLQTAAPRRPGATRFGAPGAMEVRPRVRGRVNMVRQCPDMEAASPWACSRKSRPTVWLRPTHGLQPQPGHLRRVHTDHQHAHVPGPSGHVVRVRQAGITVCCGASWAWARARTKAAPGHPGRLDPHPESVPINALVRVEGTPLARERHRWRPWTRWTWCGLATARIAMPRAMVRLRWPDLSRGPDPCLWPAPTDLYGERSHHAQPGDEDLTCCGRGLRPISPDCANRRGIGGIVESGVH